jgi:hypothetical protein
VYETPRTQIYTDVYPTADAGNRRRDDLDEPAFVQQNQGWAVVFRGIVAGKESYQKFRTKGEKSADAVFRGVPYDFGISSNYTTIRIEEVATRRLATNLTNVLFARNPGVFEGDDITVYCKMRGGIYYADRIVLNDTGAVLRPTAQLPAGAVKLWVFTIIALVVLAIIFVSSGGIVMLASAIAGGILHFLGAIFPVLIIIGIGCFILRKLFGR